MTENNENSLLEEGTRSYLNALGALSEFRRSIVETVREVVCKELSTLSTAMGVRLQEDEVVTRARPNSLASFNGQNASIGVKLDRYKEAGWTLYFGLDWWKNNVDVSVSIWLKESSAPMIFSAFKKSSPKLNAKLDSDHEIYINRPLAPNNAEQLDSVLRDIIREFSDLWSKAGGLKILLKAKGQGK